MPKNVLYADDDPGLRRLVERGLGAQGVRVVAVEDGQAALERLAVEEFDVVALDYYMPRLDGFGALQRIQAMPNHPPVIIVTGAQDSAVAVNALKAGAFDYVVKDALGQFVPLLFAALASAVDAMRTRRGKEAAEAELREQRNRFEALAAERAMLLREVNHRVGNSLQLIAAFLQLQAGGAKTKEVKAALTDAMRRVMAVAQVHKRLYTSNDVQSVSVDQYLKALVEDLSHTDASDISALSLAAEPLELDPDRAVAIGVIVNELVLNAMKYAYPDQKGPIRVGLKAHEWQACHPERGRRRHRSRHQNDTTLDRPWPLHRRCDGKPVGCGCCLRPRSQWYACCDHVRVHRKKRRHEIGVNDPAAIATAGLSTYLRTMTLAVFPGLAVRSLLAGTIGFFLTSLPVQAASALLASDSRPEWLAAITNPDAAFVLLIVGIYALLLEFAHPGAVIPALIGLVCLALAAFALSALPVQYGALALLIVGIALMTAEAFTPGFGVLGLLGFAGFVGGAYFLFEAPAGSAEMRVSLPLIGQAWPSPVRALSFWLSALPLERDGARR